MKKRFLVIILCLALFLSLGTLFCTIGTEVNGNEANLISHITDLESVEKSSTLLPTTESISELRKIGSELLEDEDLFISEKVAFYIAQFFIADIVASQSSAWNDETHIVETTVMYDETGNNITAYTFELNKGYIVVAAYIDAPMLIPEWSDIGQPVYKSLNLDADDKVVFLGAFDYFADNGTESLKSIYGDNVPRNQINNIFEAARNIENIRDDLLVDIVEEKYKEVTNNNMATLVDVVEEKYTEVANNNIVTLSGEITDPFVHAASTIYGNSWTATEWANNWEAYTNHATMSQFSGYSNHCGPTAITNLIKMYGSKYNKSAIKSDTNADVFAKVIEANCDMSPRCYTSTGGTIREWANTLIQNSFAKYSATVYAYGLYDANFTNIKNCTSATNKLMYLGVSNQGYYTENGPHAVVGYAYTKLQNTNYPSVWYSYVKVVDGWSIGSRYIYIGDLLDDSSFWEVYFT
ncbi:MAG: hypothetical protein EOM05_09190 [Clostridia bacterium]|nr:hypothetical protein [Clostridia bacterium]